MLQTDTWPLHFFAAVWAHLIAAAYDEHLPKWVWIDVFATMMPAALFTTLCAISGTPMMMFQVLVTMGTAGVAAVGKPFRQADKQKEAGLTASPKGS